MTTSVARTAPFAALSLALLLTLATSPAAAKDKEQAIASYSAHYINVNPGAVRHTNFIDIEIYRWTTDAERQKWAETLAAEGSDKMVAAMRDDKQRVGWVRLPGTTSYDLKYAREIQTEKGRQIVLATDRPFAMAELRYNTRTLDYGLTIIEFLMPADGSAGAGSIIVGAELELEAGGKLNVETASMNPLRLEDVKPPKAKKQKAKN